MSERRAPDTVLADWRAKAQQARALHDTRTADIIDEMCRDFARAAEPFTTWLGEADSMLFSGHSRAYLRHRFARWEAEGYARWNPHNRRERQYLQCILPRRYDRAAVEADARAVARADATVREVA